MARKKKRKIKQKRNPIAKILRDLLFRPKVVQSKKLYNRKKEKCNILKAAATEEG